MEKTSILHRLRLLARKAGIEVTRYDPVNSTAAQITQLLTYHKIDLVLDIGANDGGFARELREGSYLGDILSFEPLEKPYRKLCYYAESDTHWHIAPRMAIGDKNGEIEINVAGNSTSSSILNMKESHKEAAPKSVYIGKQIVKIKKLDNISHPLISSERNIYLKIDTQGYEHKVLQGALNSLKFIKGIQLELSLVELYAGQTLYMEMINYLNQMGFSLWNVIPGFTNNTTGRMLQMDCVFFRNAQRKQQSI